MHATHLLPEISIHNEVKSTSLLPAGVLIEEPELTEALKASGIDITSEFLINYVPELLLLQHLSLNCSH